ncbi:MAG: hypothetical protein JW829_00500 [Pirellulales bacterium]|nr:hypothetical protein [Pirellulales bacterium]
MSVPIPHFLLFSEAQVRPGANPEWHFVLESLDGRKRTVAADCEPDARGERVELLAVVRGLEALEQPSRVILITKSRYVSRGLERGLREWRESGWRWERFGRRVPVRDADLWQRIDHAMHFHEVECRTWRFDAGHAEHNRWLAPRTDDAVQSEELAAAVDEGVQAVLIVRNRSCRTGKKPSLWALVNAWWRWLWHIPSLLPTR